MYITGVYNGTDISIYVNGMINGTKYEKVLKKTLLDDQLTHFNISVLLTNDFMNAVEKDDNWNFISPSTEEVVKTISNGSPSMGIWRSRRTFL